MEGFLNLTADHTLLPWYNGTDEKLIEAIDIVSQGGWRNQVTAFHNWMSHVIIVFRIWVTIVPLLAILVHTSFVITSCASFVITSYTSFGYEHRLHPQMANSVFGGSGLPMSLTWNETQRLYLFHRSNGAGYVSVFTRHLFTPI